jgi:GDP-4-dehydro-6-deoxy-D-mannose reductase
VRQLLDLLLTHSGLHIEVRPDPARMRPSDTPDLICDYEKLNRVTGWHPRIDLTQTLGDLLNYWRERVNSGGTEQ